MVLIHTYSLQKADHRLAPWIVLQKKRKQQNKPTTGTLFKTLLSKANISHESKCFIQQVSHMTLLKS